MAHICWSFKVGSVGMFLCFQKFWGRGPGGWIFVLGERASDAFPYYVRCFRELNGRRNWTEGGEAWAEHFFYIHAFDQHFSVSFSAKDLILWESVTVPNFPSCLVKLSLKCGQEIGMHLPKTCRNVGQSASFLGSMAFLPTPMKQLTAEPWPSDSNDTNQKGAWTVLDDFAVKFFDDGECFVEGIGPLLALCKIKTCCRHESEWFYTIIHILSMYELQ